LGKRAKEFWVLCTSEKDFFHVCRFFFRGCSGKGKLIDPVEFGCWFVGYERRDLLVLRMGEARLGNLRAGDLGIGAKLWDFVWGENLGIWKTGDPNDRVREWE
jgi:hypothetical protein